MDKIPWLSWIHDPATHRTTMASFLLIVFLLGVVVYDQVVVFPAFEAQNNSLKGQLADLNQSVFESLARERSFTLNRLSVWRSGLESTILGNQADANHEIQILRDSFSTFEDSTYRAISKLSGDINAVSLLNPDFSRVASESFDSVVSISTPTRQASGFIVSEDGLIITNRHVVKGESSFTVRLRSGKSYSATLLKISSTHDIAVLKINQSVKPLSLGDSADVTAGQNVIAIGNPAGLDYTITKGIISATNRSVADVGTGLLQMDVAVNPGNSGGPILDAQGQVIGMTTAKLNNNEGLGFAIASNDILILLEQLS